MPYKCIDKFIRDSVIAPFYCFPLSLSVCHADKSSRMMEAKGNVTSRVSFRRHVIILTFARKQTNEREIYVKRLIIRLLLIILCVL